MEAQFNQHRCPKSMESLLSAMGITGCTVATGKGNRQLGHAIPLGDEAGQHHYLVAKNNKNEGIYWVAGPESWLTEEVYEAITEEARAAGLASVYHICSKLSLVCSDDIVWYQSSAN